MAAELPSESPFSQYFNTNYSPTSAELSGVQELITNDQSVVDSLNASIAQLVVRRELYTQRIESHTALAGPVRRLPSEILAAIFLDSVVAHNSPPSHLPSVTISHVCQQWRDLSLDMPLLWVNLDITIPPYPVPYSTDRDSRGPIPFSELSAHDKAAYSSHVLTWTTRIQRLCERVDVTIDRSAGSPLNVSVTARDPPAAAFQGHGNSWMNVLNPLSRMLRNPYTRLGSLRLHLRMSPDVSLLTPYTRLATIGNLELTTLELDIAYNGARLAGERLWEVENWAINAQAAPLTSLTARMDFSDTSLIKAQWGALVELTIGSSVPDVVCFGAQDAINVLRWTPNLERCTVDFDACETHTPCDVQQQPVHLSMLQSLTLTGTSPSVSFTSLLLLPSIIHLSLAQRKSDVPEDKNTSGLANLVERYGHQLTHVAFSYPSLKPMALLYVLNCLSNVSHLELTARSRSSMLIAVERTPGLSTLQSQGSDSEERRTKIEPGLLHMLTPQFGRTGRGLAKPCLCPNLQKLVCNLYEVCDERTKDSFVDFIEARRSVPDEGGPVAWLGEVNLNFWVGPVEEMMGDLQARGVKMEGIVVKAERAHACWSVMRVPIPGFGRLRLEMDPKRINEE